MGKAINLEVELAPLPFSAQDPDLLVIAAVAPPANPCRSWKRRNEERGKDRCPPWPQSLRRDYCLEPRRKNRGQKKAQVSPFPLFPFSPCF